MKVPLGLITRSGLLDPFHYVPELGGHIANSLWHVPWLHHASLYGIVMGISFLHLSYSCIAFCMSHCIIMHLPLTCFLFYKLHTFYFHCSHVMHDPCIFLCKTKKEQQEVMKVYTTFLVTCVGYHNDGYQPTMLGLYTHFSKKNDWQSCEHDGT